MTAVPVSVVIASHRRPAALRLCLTALRFQDYRPFEVIVVADLAGLDMVGAMAVADRVKTAHVEAPGIAAARNAGLALAAGDIVAFIDDDAVAEPTWLTQLAAGLEGEGVTAAGGFVRGRNGISFQWRARWADACARHFPLEVPEDRVSLHRGSPDRAIRTEGTNMAFRRDLLVRIGGFDEGYGFFLDETDVNMRLARIGAITAIVPRAQVHHGFAPGPFRHACRTPRSLYEIGRSSARFLRKFAPSSAHERALEELRKGQHAALIARMIGGQVEPRDVARLMRTLDEGIARGTADAIGPLAPLTCDPPAFRPFVSTDPRPPVWLAGRGWWRARLRRRARRLAAGGYPVTLFLFTHTARYHRMRFVPDGYWVQSGGMFGRSVRGGPLVRFTRFGARVRAECARLRAVRPLSPPDR
ncbi:GT2 family glycosyltransferase [Rhodovulum bhavnagarense]|uniref:GT2 family glycosyltransferase n=1 Tax=Rhodovulum bhavnagarense TaxID=992286 RepID=A0A4V2SW63_9RHOB|nr:glycosyltransferase family A protein [Rhodovulum bhavnagarense]TCP61056.1 GT2 family glycosyltransferase [Rhodovulum bhavnagarense]